MLEQQPQQAQLICLAAHQCMRQAQALQSSGPLCISTAGSKEELVAKRRGPHLGAQELEHAQVFCLTDDLQASKP